MLISIKQLSLIARQSAANLRKRRREPFPGGGNHILKRTAFLLLSLTALPTIAYDFASCRAQANPHHQGKKHIHTLKAVAVKIENPGCPGCLKTLKEQLLKMSGVKAVKLTVPEDESQSTSPPAEAAKSIRPSKSVLITVDYDPARINEQKILERMRFHDLHILEPSAGQARPVTPHSTPRSTPQKKARQRA